MRIWILMLKVFAYLWLVAATLFVVAGIIGVWTKGGFSAVQELLSPFNIANVVVTVLTLAPGLAALAWADHLKARLVRLSPDEASREQTPSSAGSPQMPDPGRPFDSALRDLGNRLLADSGFGPCENLADAAGIVLTDITTSTLTQAGFGHLPHPMASAKTNASMGACFMAAALSCISVRLKRIGLELPIQDVFARAGLAVFQMYPDAERAQIISAGSDIFKELVGESSSRENLREWIEGVQTLTASYVLTGDKAWIPLLAKLYGTLAAARE